MKTKFVINTATWFSCEWRKQFDEFWLHSTFEFCFNIYLRIGRMNVMVANNHYNRFIWKFHFHHWCYKFNRMLDIIFRCQPTEMICRKSDNNNDVIKSKCVLLPKCQSKMSMKNPWKYARKLIKMTLFLEYIQVDFTLGRRNFHENLFSFNFRSHKQTHKVSGV